MEYIYIDICDKEELYLHVAMYYITQFIFEQPWNIFSEICLESIHQSSQVHEFLSKLSEIPCRDTMKLRRWNYKKSLKKLFYSNKTAIAIIYLPVHPKVKHQFDAITSNDPTNCYIISPHSLKTKRRYEEKYEKISQ